MKGAGYIQKRDNVERGLFPELSEDRPAVANERPTYAALNLLRQRTGAAPTYGTVALHLKPEVARRAHLHRGRYLRRAAPALYRSGASGRP